MRKSKFWYGIAAAMCLLVGQAGWETQAHSGHSTEVQETTKKYRAGVMQVISWNAAYFFDVLKGVAVYDAEEAQKRADNLNALAAMPWEAFAERPSQDYIGHSSPAIWENPEDFQAKISAFTDAASHLASVAGSGEGAAKAAAAQLGGACKECHDDYTKE